jgi:hypothetical protein
MAAYLLTWNPSLWRWGTLTGDISAVREGRLCGVERWSTGRTTSIHSGDRLFLLRQGRPPRGVMASGFATSDCYKRTHWGQDEALRRGRVANYVDLVFDVILNPSQEELLGGPDLTLGQLSTVNWSPFASGAKLPDAATPELETLWSWHLRHIGLAAQHVEAPLMAP